MSAQCHRSWTASTLITACFMALATTAGAGTTWIVDAAGSGDYATIQEAVDAATSGDAITVLAGTYIDDDADGAVIYIGGKDLSIVADGVVTIDGETLARGIYSTGGSLFLLDLAFVNCAASSGSGGGICYRAPGDFLEVYSCSFTACTAMETYRRGGGIFLEGTVSSYVSFWLSGCEFTGCVAAGFAGAIESDSANGIIDFSTFSGNSAGLAGAIEQRSGWCQLYQCEFTSNSSSQGGALRLYHDSGEFLMESCTFSENVADYGSVLHRSRGDVTMDNCTVEDNTSTYCGALYLQDNDEFATVQILDCRFTGNVGIGSGGGGSDSCIGGTEGIDLDISGTTFCDHLAGTEVVLSYTDGGGNDLGNWCCPGDVDQDGAVTVDDLSDVLTAFGDASMDEDDREDASRDGLIDITDLLGVLQQWGVCE